MVNLDNQKKTIFLKFLLGMLENTYNLSNLELEAVEWKFETSKSLKITDQGVRACLRSILVSVLSIILKCFF